MTIRTLARAAFALLLVAAPAAAQTGQAQERARQERERAAAARAQAHTQAQAHAQAAFAEDAERRAFDMLLRHRAQLELTEQQVRRLEDIRARLEQQNAPLRSRLAEEHHRYQAERRAQLERMSAEQRRAELRRLRQHGRPPVPPSRQPTVRQMRLNNNEAVHQAQGVLTAEQRLRAQALIRQEMQRTRRARTEVESRRQRRQERMEGHAPGAAHP